VVVGFRSMLGTCVLGKLGLNLRIVYHEKPTIEWLVGGGVLHGGQTQQLGTRKSASEGWEAKSEVADVGGTDAQEELTRHELTEKRRPESKRNELQQDLLCQEI
jgi:hypothetical protein